MDQLPTSGDGSNPTLEMRVARLEGDMQEIKAILGRLEPMIIRIDATLPHLATKAELADFRTESKSDLADLRTELKGELGDIKARLAEMPSKAYLWLVLAALIAAYAAGLAALAVLK